MLGVAFDCFLWRKKLTKKPRCLQEKHPSGKSRGLKKCIANEVTAPVSEGDNMNNPQWSEAIGGKSESPIRFNPKGWIKEAPGDK